MPDRGLRSFDGLSLPELEPTASLILPDARWLQVTFEVDRDTALSYLPCAVSRPIPTYARVLFVSAAELKFAVASAGGRYRMMPRNVVISAVSPGNLLGATFGSGSTDGIASLVRDGARLEASASINAATFSTTVNSLYAIEPSMLRWDPYLVVGKTETGPELAEVTLTAIPERAFLSKSVTMDAGQDAKNGHPWRRLRSLGLISACYVEGALTFSSPQTQEPLG
jgi:hypothetical protein